jgi:hypothetical protein
MLEIEATRLDRIDIYVDGRPQQTHDIADRLKVGIADPREEIRVEGYSGENLQQIRTVRLT